MVVELLNLSIMTVASVVFFALGHASGHREKRLVPEVPLYLECICTHRVNAHRRRGSGACDSSIHGSACACNFFVPVQKTGL